VPARPYNACGKRERAIEGATFTDSYQKIGFTYYLHDGMLNILYWDEQKHENVRLLGKRIHSAEEFEKCVKQADRKIKYRENRRR